jgi:hypothetical protein
MTNSTLPIPLLPPDALFANVSEALSSPNGNVNAPTHKFSILNRLESFRDIDGQLHFVQSWPGQSLLFIGSSCLDNPFAVSGPVVIITPAGATLPVFCDMTTDGGGYVHD